MEVKVINKSNNKLPEYKTLYSAGLDIRSDFSRIKSIDNLQGVDVFITKVENEEVKQISIKPGGRVLIPTGIYTEIPIGYHIDVRPRSGLAIKKGLTVLNTPGLVDSDYRDEYGIIIINLSNDVQYIDSGERIAQLVMMHSERIDWNEVKSLNTSERKGGFGSTGNA